jgi:N-acyl-D-amino-acid deacylase
MYDLLIQNGVVIDGTGAARYPADLAIRGDRIEHVGKIEGAETQTVIEAGGKIVAPGFVDVHNHSDAWLLKQPHFVAKTMQGFTTEVIMADGISYAPVNRHTVHDWIYYLRALNGLRLAEYQGWERLADYMALLDGKTAQNVMTHIPYANLRAIAAGFGRHTPDDYQLRQIQGMVEQGMAAGAVGLSTGLDYIAECFASTDELIAACAPMAAAQGLYVTHVRYKKGTLAGIQEAVEIGKRAGVPVHISHMKGDNPRENAAILAYVDRVATNEVDFSFDVYPYQSSSTMLNYLLPYEVWEDGPLGVLPKLKERHIRTRFAHSLETLNLDGIRIAWLPGADHKPYQGYTLWAYAEAVHQPPADALCDLLIEAGLAVLLVFQRGDEELVAPFLAHNCYLMGSDGIYVEDGLPHPRVYGSAARLLGHYARDQKLFSLETAVYKLSGYPAARFGLQGRGVIRAGCFADLVVFDAASIHDPATFAAPNQYAVGVEQVIVNGVPVIRDGQPVADFARWPGRYLKFHQ